MKFKKPKINFDKVKGCKIFCNLDGIKSVMVPIHKEGYRFIAIFAFVSIVFMYFDWGLFTFIGIILTVWCALFFRDPKRFTPTDSNSVISPADGVVQMITTASPPPELKLGATKLTRISVFMNVFNVHINRSPVAGVLSVVKYKKGAFFNADLDKASDKNERQSFVIETASKEKVVFVQIAGLVARRISGFVKKGDSLKAGERFGLIRFGSRVDVYLPSGAKPTVLVGQTCIAGESVIATLKAKSSTHKKTTKPASNAIQTKTSSHKSAENKTVKTTIDQT